MCIRDRYYAILIKQALITFKYDPVLLSVLEVQPGSSVCERVGAHSNGGVKGCSHARTGLSIPGATDNLRINVDGFSELQFFLVGA